MSHRHWIDMTCNLMSYLTVFQSYQNVEMVIMNEKVCAVEPCL